MNRKLALFGKIMAWISMVLCFWGGLTLVVFNGDEPDANKILQGLGVYFIGISLYVGPLLYIRAEDSKGKKLRKGLVIWGKVASVASSIVCFLGGLIVSFGDSDFAPIGLYFIGIAFFVGPFLYITTIKARDRIN